MRRLLTLLFVLPAMATLAADAPPGAVRIASGVSGHIHPAVCVTKNGTVIVVFGQSDMKDLRVTRSTDGGKTWTTPTAFGPSAKMSIYPGSLTTLADGRVVHVWNTWYPLGEKKKSRFPQYSFSDDEGRTWTEAQSFPKNPTDAESVIRHPLVVLGQRQWIAPLMDRTVTFDPTTGTSVPFGDHNHKLVPIVRTPKGTLVSGAGLRSEDGGKTWQKVAPFPAVGENGWRFDMACLSNGWLVASEVIGPGVGGDKWRFVVSRDDGKTWNFDKTVEFYNPGRPIGGRACPRTVSLDKDTIGTVFYDVDAKQEGGPGVYFLRTPLAKLGS